MDYFKKHRNLRKHWLFPLDFPNFEVISAYKQPVVDESKERFSWGDVDFGAVRDLAKHKL